MQGDTQALEALGGMLAGLSGWAEAPPAGGRAPAVRCPSEACSPAHDPALCSPQVFGSPLSFFDTTPTGRLLNCFVGDLDQLDQLLPIVAEEFLVLLLAVTLNLMVASALSPFILLTGVVLMVACLTGYT